MGNLKFKHYLIIVVLLLVISCPIGFAMSKYLQNSAILPWFVAFITLPNEPAPSAVVVTFLTPTPLPTRINTATSLPRATLPPTPRKTAPPEKKEVASATSTSSPTMPATDTPTATATSILARNSTHPKESTNPVGTPTVSSPKGVGGTGAILLQMGRVQVKQGNLSEALKSYQQAETAFEAVNDLDGQAQSWYEMGRVYELLSHFIPALSNYEYALALFGQTNNSKGEAITTCAIGHVYNSQGKFKESEQTYERVLADYGYKCLFD